jgi:hypothetical protein
LQRRDKPHCWPLLLGERGALLGAELLDDGNARLGRVDVGFGRLDSCGDGGGSVARFGGIAARGGRRCLESRGAFGRNARIGLCLRERLSFVIDALRRRPTRRRDDGEQGDEDRPRDYLFSLSSLPYLASKAAILPVASRPACSTHSSRTMRPLKLPR